MKARQITTNGLTCQSKLPANQNPFGTALLLVLALWMSSCANHVVQVYPGHAKAPDEIAIIEKSRPSELATRAPYVPLKFISIDESRRLTGSDTDPDELHVAPGRHIVRVALVGNYRNQAGQDFVDRAVWGKSHSISDEISCRRSRVFDIRLNTLAGFRYFLWGTDSGGLVSVTAGKRAFKGDRDAVVIYSEEFESVPVEAQGETCADFAPLDALILE